MMRRFADGDSNDVCDMVTGDQSWILCYETEIKRQSAHSLQMAKRPARADPTFKPVVQSGLALIPLQLKRPRPEGPAIYYNAGRNAERALSLNIVIAFTITNSKGVSRQAHLAIHNGVQIPRLCMIEEAEYGKRKMKDTQTAQEPPESDVQNETLIATTDLEEIEEVQYTDTSYTSASFEELIVEGDTKRLQFTVPSANANTQQTRSPQLLPSPRHTVPRFESHFDHIHRHTPKLTGPTRTRTKEEERKAKGNNIAIYSYAPTYRAADKSSDFSLFEEALPPGQEVEEEERRKGKKGKKEKKAKEDQEKEPKEQIPDFPKVFVKFQGANDGADHQREDDQCRPWILATLEKS
ncbi:hypothetical protein EVAR_45792_1 [Eumeta japonica]|uniref:Uncharacterized protein n=1 Tax=Eumeta variegata TaxID=151549 RepID=A0A4C1X420_EUMVA|nr:hypothetical protein EVAR_45792_1 [Eumeta japonica]